MEKGYYEKGAEREAAVAKVMEKARRQRALVIAVISGFIVLVLLVVGVVKGGQAWAKSPSRQYRLDEKACEQLNARHKPYPEDVKIYYCTERVNQGKTTIDEVLVGTFEITNPFYFVLEESWPKDRGGFPDAAVYYQIDMASRSTIWTSDGELFYVTTASTNGVRRFTATCVQLEKLLAEVGEDAAA